MILRRKTARDGVRAKHKRYGVSHWWLSGMAAPGLIWIFIFSYIPMFGLIIAFKNYKYSLGIMGSQWVGLKNFIFLLRSNTFSLLVRNTLCYNLAFITMNVVCGIFVALLLENMTRKTAVKVFQSSMFVPYFLSWVVVAYVGHACLDYSKGMFNHIITMMGGEAVSFYSEPKYWPFILVGFNTWKALGFNVLIYYGTILGIDTELYEAAMIDGCGYFKRVRYITLPHLMATVIILTLLALGGIFRSDFGLFYYMTKDSGALYKITDVVDTYVTRSLLTTSSVGQSSAAGFMQSVVGLVTILLANGAVRKIDRDSALF